jgi:hypothetical protein
LDGVPEFSRDVPQFRTAGAEVLETADDPVREHLHDPLQGCCGASRDLLATGMGLLNIYVLLELGMGSDQAQVGDFAGQYQGAEDVRPAAQDGEPQAP